MKKYKGNSGKIIFSVLSLVVIFGSMIAFAMFSPLLFGGGFLGAAIFTPSPIMGEIRKKAGSDVFSKNHYGPFFRKLIKPVNGKTSFQSEARAIIKSLSQGWKNIGQANILAWNAYAKLHQFKNTLGQGIYLTGEAMYIKLNAILLNCHQAISATPPPANAVNPAALTSFAGTGTTTTGVISTLTLAFAPVIGAAQTLLIYASPVVSGGRTYNSNYRLIAAKTSTFLTGDAILTDYTSRFGSVGNTGSVIFIKSELVDNATGLASQQVVSRVVLS
jgi:hypothetical protein